MTKIDLIYGGEYNFKYQHQPEKLKYIGKKDGCYQFQRIGTSDVWCELLEGDLSMIEETENHNKCACDTELVWSALAVKCLRCDGSL